MVIRFIVSACTSLVIACAAARSGDDDAGPNDATTEILRGPEDAVADRSPNDTSLADDAELDADAADAASDVEISDASVDAADAADASADAAPDVMPGGDTCPIFGTTPCSGGFEFRTHYVDASVDYNCGAVTPHCPKGWICWALNSQYKPVYATCP